LKSKGRRALIIDGLRDRLSKEGILNVLRQNNITVAGITCLSAYYNQVVALSRFLKKNGVKVIIGGVHPTFLHWKTLEDSGADFVVCGEGEQALFELLKNNLARDLPAGGVIQGVYSQQDTPHPRLRLVPANGCSTSKCR
jgi:radical SAM superfamily enzyme YgiQ (UPF0313 family)